MKRFKRVLNDFCESTTVHGFAYLTTGQNHSTRFIWSLIVFMALSVASLLLIQTLGMII